MVKGTSRKTPVRSALVETSELLPSVADGLGALSAAHRELFDREVRASFADSLDLDEAMKRGREEENRWDYLLGHGASGEVVAVEPHSAKDGQTDTVLKKKIAARAHLKDHLRDGARIHKWLWVSAGKVHFANTEKTKFLLLQNGIDFAGSKITAKHLSSASKPASARRLGRKR
jgi:hypothetical protein